MHSNSESVYHGKLDGFDERILHQNFQIQKMKAKIDAFDESQRPLQDEIQQLKGRLHQMSTMYEADKNTVARKDREIFSKKFLLETSGVELLLQE